MRECEHCKYLKRIGYEYPTYECQIFGEETPEKFENEKGGCCLHYKELEKLNRILNEYWKYYNKYFNHLLKKYGNKEAKTE